jgi:hypothetical protein
MALFLLYSKNDAKEREENMTGAMETIEEVPEFTGKAADALREFYTQTKVVGQGPQAKIAALEANLGKFEFSAYGGGETDITRLRAAERVYLLKFRIPAE